MATTTPRLLPAALIALATCLLPMLAHAQERPALLVLGSAHFGNPGNDVNNREVEDVLTPRRQQELADVVQQLAEFRPTHIAVEISGPNQPLLDERYQAYRDGTYELSRNESDQIGLRLAASLGHERVYAVDWNGELPGDEADYDWFTYAQAHGQQAVIDRITSPEITSTYYFELGDQTIGQWLTQLNAESALQASHSAYFDIASIGEGDTRIGADWVGTWYARNLKIYSRLAELATTPDARVLIIFGQGHAHLLQQFTREHGHFELVDVGDVLGE